MKEKEIIEELNNSKDIDSQLFYFNKVKSLILAEGIKSGRKQLAGEYLKKIQEIYEACNDEWIQSIQLKIGDLGKELQKEAEE